jgi:hypothetical protein
MLAGEVGAALWFCAVVAGLWCCLPPASRCRSARRSGALAGARRVSPRAVAMTVLANIALYRHDAQFDLTRERAFTPSAEARRIVQGLASRCS